MIVSLALIFGIAAFATDMYLPAFPAISRAFDTSPQAVQWSLSVFLYGNAAGHLIFGPLSDRYGRKPVLLVGIATFAVTSFGCALALDIESFYAYRAGQGAAAASGRLSGWISDKKRSGSAISSSGCIAAIRRSKRPYR